MSNYDKNPLYVWNKGNAGWRLGFGLVWFAVVALAALLFSCDSFVEVDLPDSQLTADAVFEDPTTAHAAMTEVYSKMRDGGLLSGNSAGLSHVLGNYADELDFYGSPQNGVQLFYNNALTGGNPDVKTLWDASYQQIYSANAVLEGVSQSTALGTADRQQLRGEALFARALVHFYLANVYGAVPYCTSTDYQVNRLLSRVPVDEVYAQVAADLEEAAALLSEEYVGYDRVRPNRFAARALLARVYLYSGLWNEASNEASAVLNQTSLYSMAVDLNGTFVKESLATIWQFSPSTPGGNTLESNTFIFTSGPPPLSAVSASLLNAFESNDGRKTQWLNSVSDGASEWYYPFKYKENSTTSSSVEHSVVLRLSEVYLIRAEARVRAGDLIGGRDDLNVVRNVAGLPTTTAVTQADLLDAVLAERRVELFTEFGHRFFDLKRFGKLNAVLGTKSGWNATDALFPVPEAELNLNPNLLPQNPGY